jgi:hypothetical protein
MESPRWPDMLLNSDFCSRRIWSCARELMQVTGAWHENW